MKSRLLSTPLHRAVVLGVLLLGLTLLIFRVGGGLAAKDGQTSKAQDKKQSAQRIPHEKLLYEGKSFEQWREVLFTDLSRKTLITALEALGAFGRKGYGPEAAALILKRMGDYDLESDDKKDEEVVEIAVYGLMRMGPASLTVVQNGLRDKNEKVRVFAIMVLSDFGDKAKSSVPALFQAMEHGTVKERVAAIHAIDSIDSSNSRLIPALVNALKDKESNVRRTAIEKLSSINFFATRLDTLSAFACAVDDRDEQVRSKALKALKHAVSKLGPKATDAIPGLITALKGNACDELDEVVDMLSNIGPAAKEAVPVLMQFLKTPPPKARYKGVEDGRCLQGYSPQGYFQWRVYDALEKITGKKPSAPRPQRVEIRNSSPCQRGDSRQ